MSLRWRLAVGLAVIVAGAIAAGGTAAYLSTSRQLHDDADAFLEQRAAPFDSSSLSALLAGLDPDLDAHPSASGHGRRFFSPDALVQLVDADGRVAYAVPGQPVLPVAEVDRGVATGGAERVVRDVSAEGASYRMLTVPLPGGGAVQVARDTSESTTLLARLRSRLLLIGGLATLGAAGAGWLLARRMARPVERLTATAETIAETRDLDSPIAVRGRDEVGRLGSSFNAMVAALRISREQQRRLVADAGHELRTPLTSLRTNIELLHRGVELDEEDRRRLLDDLVAEVRGLSDLVDELVELATDQAVPEEPAEDLRLDELAERVCAQARRRSGRDITVVTQCSTPVRARRAMIERAIGNLVANALKFSPADAPVEVVVEGRTVEVRDHGPGIPDAERDLVFERFYRPAESQSVPGSGLGLAIVKEVVERHHGTVTVGTADGHGAVVGFTLPGVG